jgi:hypothetical protein
MFGNVSWEWSLCHLNPCSVQEQGTGKNMWRLNACWTSHHQRVLQVRRSICSIYLFLHEIRLSLKEKDGAKWTRSLTVGFDSGDGTCRSHYLPFMFQIPGASKDWCVLSLWVIFVWCCRLAR